MSKPEIASVMIIDDTPENLHLLESMLRQRNFKVLEFPNGRLALKALERNTPALILLDIIMPEMDGYEVCRRLKAEEKLREIPVIFLSALSETVDKVKGFNAGGVDYITKPFQIEEVKARVETHIKISCLQKELQEKCTALNELEKFKENLMHLIVHDMHSPLQVILGYVELMLLKEESLGEQFVKALHAIERQAIIITDTVTDLRDVAQIEEGRMNLEKAPLKINDIVRHAAHSVNSQMQGRKFEVSLPEQDIYAHCDPQILRRIIVNLLTNAFNTAPLTAEIRLLLSSCEGRARIEVKDTGPGIRREYQAHIFEKFNQIEVPDTGRKYSTGLALNFCKLAVEGHGGSIGMTSEIGKGSTFWFELPIHNLQPDETTVAPVAETSLCEAER